MDFKIKNILKKLHISRTFILLLVFFGLSFILVREIFSLQIIEGQDYIRRFQSMITKTRVLKSTRGNIYDSQGNLLAWNELSYSLTLEDNGSYETLREKALTLNGIAYRVLQILSQNGDTLSDNFHITMDESGRYVYDVGEGFTLSRFKADVYGYRYIDELKPEERSATAEEMMAHLCGDEGFDVVLYGDDAYDEEELLSHGLPLQLTRQEILNIVIIRYLLSTNSFQRYMPVTIATNVSQKSVAAIMENMDILQGIDVVEDSRRVYKDSVSLGPIIGYIGNVSAEELERLRQSNPNYSIDAVVGKAGLEQYMELTLQGTNGKETLYVDNLGKVLRIDPNTQENPKAGSDVYITINTDWQDGIYELLKQRVAGILLSKLEATKEFDYNSIRDAAAIKIPIYDVYNALVANSVVDIRKFDEPEASQVEKTMHQVFLQKQQEVFAQIRQRLAGDNPPAYREEQKEMQEYFNYICDTLLRDTLGIISREAVDNSDATYLAYNRTGTISLKDYLTYATSQNWIDISKIDLKGDYLDSAEVYHALTDYIVEYLESDFGFSKLLYKYMLHEDRISGLQLCLTLYEQGVLSKEDDMYNRLLSGSIGAYDFMVSKIWNLEIEPAMLALSPCAASAVVVEVGTGKVLAVVSYPGYESNRLTNNSDSNYFAKMALDLSSPFFNKATQQQTAPGSTFKLVSTVAGMMEGVIDDNTYINCTGSFDYVDPPIACWNIYGHGSLEVREAIQESCNYFFNTIGFRLGRLADDRFSETQSLLKLQEYCSYFALDQKTGIEISEAAPQVSYSLAIPSYMGQGTHNYTTSQLARYASVLASQGTVNKLSILDRVVDADNKVLQSFTPTVINEMSDVPQNVWDDVSAGMIRVVQTHNEFDDLSIQVAGKTGTAEVDYYTPNHGLFIGYAPAYDPQYAIAVRLPSGFTSGNACLAAHDIVQYIFNLVDKEELLTGYASSDTSDISND